MVPRADDRTDVTATSEIAMRWAKRADTSAIARTLGLAVVASTPAALARGGPTERHG